MDIVSCLFSKSFWFESYGVILSVTSNHWHDRQKLLTFDNAPDNKSIGLENGENARQSRYPGLSKSLFIGRIRPNKIGPYPKRDGGQMVHLLREPFPKHSPQLDRVSHISDNYPIAGRKHL